MRTPELERLAIFGGRPAFAEPLHVGRPNIGDRAALLRRIEQALDRSWLTNGGPLVEEFERRVSELVEADHCVAVSSATVGIQLAARALELTGEVVVPSFTFVGTAHALSWIGLTPVFCDVDPVEHCADPASVERAITPATTAILAVHLWGRPCDVEGLTAVAQRHDLRLVFDASHALGCSYAGRTIGSFGDAEVFSFHATKVANAAEGGAITTNDPSVARKLRLMRNFGFVGYDTVAGLGTNGKMSELTAAMGLTSLDALGTFIEVNRTNVGLYADELADLEGARLMPFADRERHNFHYVVLELDHATFRDDLVAVLHAENVLVRRYFHPGCHRLAPYDARPASLPVTEDVSGRVVVLPTGTATSASDIARVCALIRLALGNAEEIRGALSPAQRER